MKASRPRVFAVAGIVLLGAYFAGYALVRSGRLIVHRSSVAGDRYASHSVEPGDARLAGGYINGVVALIYTPLRYAELGYWHLRQPLDSPLSEAERRRRSE